MTFRRIDPGDAGRLRVVVAGAGGMGRAWLAAIAASDDVELAGVADLDVGLARRVVDELASPSVPVGSDGVELAVAVGADALVDVTVPLAHHPVTTAALFSGLPVLGEKPIAATLPEALSLAAAAQVTGELFMVSQSRRWNPQLFALRDAAVALGPIGSVTTEFFKAPHFGGFREEMAHPLLVDMAIHPFDSARFLLASEPVSVFCAAHNPPWSWFGGAANAYAVFTFASGARYVYAGSWCSPGAETSWNGSWRVSGQGGTALWDGDTVPQVALAPDGGWDGQGIGGDEGLALQPVSPSTPVPGLDGIDWALAEFVIALRTGIAPMGAVHENVMSLAMVEAAVRSADTGAPVLIDAVLEQALERAAEAERNDDVRAVLKGWTDVRQVLTEGGR